MTRAATDAREIPGTLEQIATRIVFLVVGTALASWAPLVPLTRERLSLDEAQLGTLLLCLGLGSVSTMPFSGGLAGRFGCRRTILFAGTVAAASLPLMAVAPSPLLLAMSLWAFGAGIGTMDVVMNIQAVIVEKASGRSMMSGFHGMFSVGGIFGAGAVTAMLSAGASPLASTMAVSLVSLALLAGYARGLLPYGSEEDSPPFAFPKGHVLLIGALAFILFLAEGSVMDWSGVLLNVERGLDKSRAGLGYVAFSVAMTVGRLLGDRVVNALGPTRILFFGALIAASGFLLAATVPFWPATILGFALVGVGASNVVPVLFTAAGRQDSMPSNLAIAAITTMGYAGILLGPALVGFAARTMSLPAALLIVATMVAFVALSAKSATSPR